MLDGSETEAARQATRWLEAFNAAPDAQALAAIFEPDAHWRDLSSLGDRFATISAREAVAPALAEALSRAGARDFRLDPARRPPERLERSGETVDEAILAYDTDAGPGEGVVRLRRGPDGAPRAWTLMTALAGLPADAPRPEPEAVARDFHGLNWLDRREASRAYADRDPAVLIVGGGHAGLTAAARLTVLGIDTLVLDRMTRIGDNWRLRYHALMLHNQKHSNHLPYLPFPETWPRYIPKDKIANWLELYVEAMEINFWTETSFEGATRDETAGCWDATLTLRDGTQRTLRPRHIIMATSVSGTPNIPDIPTLDRFAGEVLHSSRFGAGADWSGRPVMVIGTGTSGHDIAQDLAGAGAHVTMVQRNPTLVVNVEPSAQLYDGIYLGDGPSLEDRDLLNLGTPFEPMKQAHRQITAQTRELDAPLLEGLERVGFRLDFGEDGTGWPLKYRTRGGGYYFNVGCSELIASGEIGLIQSADIESFEGRGARLSDGRLVEAELIVLATGYKGQDHLVRQLFEPGVAERLGPVWGFDETQELRNMWTRTPQPGLWFTAGAFSQCRAFSKYLALQIAQDEARALRGPRRPASRPAPPSPAR